MYSVSMETRIGASCSSSPTIFVCNMIVYVLMLRFPRLFGKRFHVFFHWIHSIPQCIYLYNFIFFNYGLCASFLQLTYRYGLQNINPIPCCLSPWLPKPPLAQRQRNFCTHSYMLPFFLLYLGCNSRCNQCVPLVQGTSRLRCVRSTP